MKQKKQNINKIINLQKFGGCTPGQKEEIFRAMCKVMDSVELRLAKAVVNEALTDYLEMLKKREITREYLKWSETMKMPKNY